LLILKEKEKKKKKNPEKKTVKRNFVLKCEVSGACKAIGWGSQVTTNKNKGISI
jgi:hypothetical protein